VRMSFPEKISVPIVATGFNKGRKSKVKMAMGKFDRMYYFRIPVILVWLLMISTAFPQETGILEGRLVNRTDAAIVPGGVQLEILALSGGMSIIRTAVTDPTGKFHIEELPLHSMLMLRAVYQDTNYNKQFSFDDSGHASVELDVFEATTSMKNIRVEEFRIVFQATGNHLQSFDTLVFNNETDPPRTFMNPEGNFQFSKAPAIEEFPQIQITAPGSSMAITQSALESPDGQTYYSLYPLRPGKTTVEVFQLLPYENRSYSYTKKFFYPVPSIQIAVIPMDMELSGTGLSKIRTDPENNIAIYQNAPVEAGTEVEWIFSGGTPVAEQESSSATAGSSIQSVPNDIGRKAGVIGSLMLMGFILVLWYAFNRTGSDSPASAGSSKRQLKERREVLLNRLADLDSLHGTGSIRQKEYQQQREDGKRMLRRIYLLLKKR
jgi:hypothetical protein